MPTYEYECIICRHRFERFHGISEKEEVFCPVCGGETKKCMTAAAGIIFKGSGFYATDYKQKKGKGKEGIKEKKE